jgi:hypothetical protein
MQKPNLDSGEAPQTVWDDSKFDLVRKRYDTAKKTHDLWKPTWEECYDYALPNRQSFSGNQTKGSKRTDRIFDSTAPTSLHEFASRLQAGLTPTFARWSKLKSGKRMSKQLAEKLQDWFDETTELVFDVLHSSNFDSQAHEAYMELGIGTASIIADEDPLEIVRFQAVPLSQIMLDAGPYNQVDGRFRTRKLTAREIQGEWPDAKLPQTILDKIKKGDDGEIEVREATVTDWRAKDSETAVAYSWLDSPRCLLGRSVFKGAGAMPWINARWSVAAGEVYGRGPLLTCLPDVKVANAVVQLVLENGEMQMVGLWQADDDGVINPSQIRLVPGTIIPKSPGSNGLQPLQSGGRFDVSQLILGDLRASIKRALYDEGLGPPTGTPMSATEVSERMQDLYRRMGSAYGRLQRELVQPVIRRTIYLLKKRGMIKLPPASHDLIDIRSESPLSSAQNQQDVLRFQQYAGTIVNTFGPERAMLILNSQRTAEWLRSQHGMRADLNNTPEEQQQLIGQLQQAMQGLGAGGK